MRLIFGSSCIGRCSTRRFSVSSCFMAGLGRLLLASLSVARTTDRAKFPTLHLQTLRPWTLALRRCVWMAVVLVRFVSRVMKLLRARRKNALPLYSALLVLKVTASTVSGTVLLVVVVRGLTCVGGCGWIGVVILLRDG